MAVMACKKAQAPRHKYTWARRFLVVDDSTLLHLLSPFPFPPYRSRYVYTSPAPPAPHNTYDFELRARYPSVDAIGQPKHSASPPANKAHHRSLPTFSCPPSSSCPSFIRSCSPIHLAPVYHPSSSCPTFSSRPTPMIQLLPA